MLLQKNVHRTSDDVVVTRTYTYIMYTSSQCTYVSGWAIPSAFVLKSQTYYIWSGFLCSVAIITTFKIYNHIVVVCTQIIFGGEVESKEDVQVPGALIGWYYACNWCFGFGSLVGESQLNAPQRCIYSSKQLRTSGCWQVHTPRTATQINLYENTRSSVAVVISGCWQNDIRNTDIPHSSHD